MAIMGAIQEWTRAIKQQRWTLEDVLSPGPLRNMADLLESVLGQSVLVAPGLLYRGSHFLYTRQPNLVLGADGYDNYQAPTDSNGQGMYSRRMWVKGSLEFDRRPVKWGAGLTTIELINSVRCLDESVFVNIQRNMATEEGPVLRESRSLIYTNEPFISRPISRHFDKPDSTLTIQLSPTHLLKYSMLTYNLHKIHYDREYCQKTENLPNIIVHGPFMITLLLHWFSTINGEVAKLTYKNIEPCFVDEPLTLQYNQIDSHKYSVSIVNATLGKKYMEGYIISTS